MNKLDLRNIIKEEIQNMLKEEIKEIDVPNNIYDDLQKHGFTSLNDLFKKSNQDKRKLLSQETKQWIQSVLKPELIKSNN